MSSSRYPAMGRAKPKSSLRLLSSPPRPQACTTLPPDLSKSHNSSRPSHGSSAPVVDSSVQKHSLDASRVFSVSNMPEPQVRAMLAALLSATPVASTPWAPGSKPDADMVVLDEDAESAEETSDCSSDDLPTPASRAPGPVHRAGRLAVFDSGGESPPPTVEGRPASADPPPGPWLVHGNLSLGSTVAERSVALSAAFGAHVADPSFSSHARSSYHYKLPGRHNPEVSQLAPEFAHLARSPGTYQVVCQRCSKNYAAVPSLQCVKLHEFANRCNQCLGKHSQACEMTPLYAHDLLFQVQFWADAYQAAADGSEEKYRLLYNLRGHQALLIHVLEHPPSPSPAKIKVLKSGLAPDQLSGSRQFANLATSISMDLFGASQSLSAMQEGQSRAILEALTTQHQATLALMESQHDGLLGAMLAQSEGIQSVCQGIASLKAIMEECCAGVSRSSNSAVATGLGSSCVEGAPVVPHVAGGGNP